MSERFMPGLSEPGEQVDVTEFRSPDSPTAIIKISGKLTERRKRQIERAVRRGRKRGWRWRYVGLRKPA